MRRLWRLGLGGGVKEERQSDESSKEEVVKIICVWSTK